MQLKPTIFLYLTNDKICGSRFDSVEATSSERKPKQEGKRGREPKLPKKIKQLQSADNDSDSEDMPIDILHEEPS